MWVLHHAWILMPPAFSCVHCTYFSILHQTLYFLTIMPHTSAIIFRNPDCLIIVLTIWLNVASNRIPAGISKTLREKICVVRKVFILCFRGKTVNIITMTAWSNHALMGFPVRTESTMSAVSLWRQTHPLFLPSQLCRGEPSTPTQSYNPL